MFDCKTYFRVPRPLRHKLEPTTKKAIMVGYEDPGYDIEFGVKSKNQCSSLTMRCLMKIISITKYNEKVTKLSLKVHT